MVPVFWKNSFFCALSATPTFFMIGRSFDLIHTQLPSEVTMNRFCVLLLLLVLTALLFPNRILFADKTWENTKYGFKDLVCDEKSKITVVPLFSDDAKETLESLLEPKFHVPVSRLLEQYARCIVNERMRYLGVDSEPHEENILRRTKLVIKYGAEGLTGIEIDNPCDFDKDWSARATLLLLKDRVVVDANFVLEYHADFIDDDFCCHRVKRFPMFYGFDQRDFIRNVSAFKELKSLQFFFEQRPDGLEELKSLSNLESLSLRFEKRPECLPEIIAAMPKLENIWITIADEESECDDKSQKYVSELYDVLASLPNLRHVHLRGMVFQHYPELPRLRPAKENFEGNFSFHLGGYSPFETCQMMDYRVSWKSFYDESRKFEGISIKKETYPVNSEEGRQFLVALFDQKYQKAALQILDGVVEALVEIACEARERPVAEWRDKIVAGMSLRFDYRSTGSCDVCLHCEFGLGEGDEEGNAEGSETKLFVVKNGCANHLDLETKYCFGFSATDNRTIAVSSKTFLDGLSKLDTLKSLHLKFDGNPGEAMLGLSKLANLEELELDMPNVPEFLPAILEKLPLLRKFHFVGCCKDADSVEKESLLVDETIEALSYCPKLTSLHIDGCVAKTGRSLPKLQSLACLSIPVTNDEVLKNIGRIPNLRKLELLATKNRWKDYGGCYSNEGLANLAPLRRLKWISFDNLELSLHSLPPLPGLVSLNISNAFLTSADLDRLGRSRNIRYMNLYSVAIPKGDEKYFAAFQNLRTLECSSMNNSFESFPALPRLEEVSVRSDVTDAGLTSILKSPKLSSVSITSNAIAKDAEKIADKRYSIQYLRVYRSQD